MNKKPVLLKATLKDYLWGGTKLRDAYGKKSDLNKIAESWELSAHKDGQSIIASGDFSGYTLSEYISACGKEILGKNAEAFDSFPILIKLIDAKDKLSVQVHPSDDYALRHEGEYGKTEVWYVVESEENACLYYGFCREISREEYRSRIADNTLTEVLNCVPAKKGDVFFIEPGTVHAIGAGLLICEVQQNSNTTYRVYDYDRKGADGKPRELHIEKAIAVTNLKPQTFKQDFAEEKSEQYQAKTIAKCKYFTAKHCAVFSEVVFSIDQNSFRSVIITDGTAKLCLKDSVLQLQKGDSVFIPAQNADCSVRGKCEFILSYV